MFVEVRPPNLNADLYKCHQEGNKIYNHLSFIDTHSDGPAVIGASDLTGRHWDGVIQISKTSWDFVLESSCPDSMTKIYSDKSLTDGKFLKDSSKIIICDDGGELRIWSKQKAWTDMGAPTQQYGWCIADEAIEHDDGILAVDIFPNNERCITASADSSLKVWDLEKLTSLMTYPAHSNIVTDVVCNPYKENVFLSGSLDKSVALWQYLGSDRKAKVYGEKSCAVRCVCWISDTVFAAGYDDGIICFFDSRYESTEHVLPAIDAKRPLERMRFNDSSKLLAVCGDSSMVDVYKISDTDSKIVYYNNETHTQFVRGVHWEGSLLYSCGWDGRVVNHDMETHKVHTK